MPGLPLIQFALTAAAMGPSLGRLGDSSHFLPSDAAAATTPQWGRASEGSETRKLSLQRTRLVTAAMGPSLGRLGDRAARRTAELPADRAAMGPSLGRLGDDRIRVDVGASCDGRRNGAEPRKARRLPERGDLIRLRHAAMGPSLGRLGDVKVAYPKCTPIAAMGPSLGRLGDSGSRHKDWTLR